MPWIHECFDFCKAVILFYRDQLLNNQYYFDNPQGIGAVLDDGILYLSEGRVHLRFPEI